MTREKKKPEKTENKVEKVARPDKTKVLLEGATKIKAVFNGEYVFSNKKEAMELYGKSRFGEKQEGKIVYSLVEALYLVEKARMEITRGKTKLSFDKFMDLVLELDSKINTKYSVFKDMRDRGFIVKTALKFGAEFRVYDKGIQPGEDHAKWILYPVRESEVLTWHDFSAKNRVAHSTKKNLLIGIVDEEGEVTYYVCQWIRP